MLAGIAAMLIQIGTHDLWSVSGSSGAVCQGKELPDRCGLGVNQDGSRIRQVERARGEHLFGSD